MYCRFFQRESGANHIVRIKQQVQSIFNCKLQQWLIFCGVFNSMNFLSTIAEIVATPVSKGMHQRRFLYIAVVNLQRLLCQI